MGRRKATPRAVNATEKASSTRHMKLKMRFACSISPRPRCSPMMAPAPVASITATPKVTQVMGMTMLMPASASEPA